MADSRVVNKEREEEILKFIKEAFCVDGTVKLVHKKMTFTAYIECVDSKRGTFNVAWDKEDSDVK